MTVLKKIPSKLREDNLRIRCKSSKSKMSGYDDHVSGSTGTDVSNKYVSKKTLAQGMFDVALLSSNTNQLVHLLQVSYDGKGNYTNSAFHTTAIVLLSISIVLQIMVGGCLMFIAMSNKQIPTRKATVQRLNNVTTLLIFFITVINVLIPPFTPSYSMQKP